MGQVHSMSAGARPATLQTQEAGTVVCFFFFFFLQMWKLKLREVR